MQVEMKKKEEREKEEKKKGYSFGNVNFLKRSFLS